MVNSLRWGIFGTGWIANRFAQGLSRLSDAELVAVGSRTLESAEHFGARYEVPHRHASYQALARDAEVDVTYVATPNPLHKEHSLLCLESGKPILCEKPFALNARKAEDVIQVAREKKLFLMGPPSRITTLAHLGETGVDEQAGIVLRYDQGQVSTLYTSIRVDSPVEPILMGTKGRIRLHPCWIRPNKLTLSLAGQETTTIEMPFERNGYQFEAAEVMDCLRASKLESDLMPLDETLSIMQTMDAIRAQWGLKYPME